MRFAYEPEDFEDGLQALKTFLEDPRPVELELRIPTALLLLAFLQLAARHPENTGPTAREARTFGEELIKNMKLPGRVSRTLKAGWEPETGHLLQIDPNDLGDRLRTVHLNTDFSTLWSVIGQIQLAACHPKVRHEMTQKIRKIADAIMHQVDTPSLLMELYLDGWAPNA